MTDSEMTPPPPMQGTENNQVSMPTPPPAQSAPQTPPPVQNLQEAPHLQGNFPQNPSVQTMPNGGQANPQPQGSESQPTPPPVGNETQPAPKVRPPQMQSENAFQNPPASVPEQSAEKERFSIEQCRVIFQNKSLLIAFCSIFVFGLLMGSCIFSGGSSSKPVQQAMGGLSGVVPNPEPNVSKLSRCGMAERGRPCLIYIVNHSRYEKHAEDFFEEASRLTEITPYSISMDNLQYAKTLIRPGQIAEIKVPAL